MSDTTVQSANQVDQWAKKFFVEYVRDSRFKRYMGKDQNAIIQLVMDLQTKAGDDVTVSLLTRLTGAGVTGDNTLEGNEEALSNFGYKVTVNQRRNAVRVGKMEAKKTQLDLLKGAKFALKNWAMEQLRDDIIDVMASANLDGVTAIGGDSEANKDAFVAANTDRILFGAAKSNNSANDHSASLANVDSTNDVLDTSMLSLLKRIAMTADPHIRPVKLAEDDEWFVCFAGPLGMRDLRTDTVIQQANREAMSRGKDNPLFRSGDLMWEGIIIREIPEIDVISGAGAAAIDVEPLFFCGAQATTVAWGERTHVVTDVQDYGNKRGTGIAEILGVAKNFYNSKQHGMVTAYVSGVADS